MPAKIYYSVDVTTSGYPVHWLDVHGDKHVCVIEHTRLDYNSADSDRAFRLQYPGAIYLKWADFIKRVGLAEAERAKMAAWNGWAK